MKYLMITLLLASISMAGFDMGIGMTVVTEKQSASDYGWTGTLSSSLDLLGIEWSTRALGSIHYPAYDFHPIMSGTIIQTAMVMLDSEMGMEAGGGMMFADDEWSPVVYYGLAFPLSSGHDVRPFVSVSFSDRETVQAGFIVSFGN